jgi:hypothetical protein
MRRKERKELARVPSSLELRRCGGGVAEEKKKEGGEPAPDLPESNRAQKMGQVKS